MKFLINLTTQSKMDLSTDTIIVLSLCCLFILIGIIFNSYLIFKTLKEKNLSNVFVVLSLIGLFSCSIFVPLIILQTFYPDSFTICSVITIINYIIDVVFVLTLLSHIVFCLLHTFFPTFMDMDNIKKIKICTSVIILIIIMAVLIVLLINVINLHLVSVCLKTAASSSSLRLSLFSGVGIFSTLLLVAASMMITELKSRYPQQQHCQEPALASKECEKSLIIAVSIFFISHTILELSLYYNNEDVSYWILLILVLFLPHGLGFICIPLFLVLKMR